jgi:hypothetical protein
MAGAVPIEWQPIEVAIQAWFAEQSGIATIWSGQDAPQRALPYAELKRISGPTKLGQDDQRETTDLSEPPGQEVALEHTGNRDFVVSCQVFAASDAPGVNADHYLGIVQASLELLSVRDTLRAAGLAVIDTTPPQDRDVVAGAAWSSRMGMDVRFRCVSSVTERIGYIETADVDRTLKDDADSTAISDTVTLGVTS